jgi:hypothetical protein
VLQSVTELDEQINGFESHLQEIEVPPFLSFPSFLLLSFPSPFSSPFLSSPSPPSVLS